MQVELPPSVGKKPLPDGWFPIVGGPEDGRCYYPSNEPIANRPVFLGLKQVPEEKRRTQYHWDAKAKSVIWTNHVSLEH